MTQDLRQGSKDTVELVDRRPAFAVWPILVIAALLAITLNTQRALAATTEVTLTPLAPSADAYVDASLPRKKFGTTSTLSAGSLPARTSYLRFGVTGVGGAVRRATLSISVASPSTFGLQVRPVTSNTWDERTITYSNAPPVGAVAASSGAFPAGRVSIDVTPLVAGNGTVNLALTSTSSTSLLMSSRETGSDGPRLSVTYAATTVPAVTLASPAPGSSTSDATTRFSGTAGDAPGDAPVVDVRVHRGTSVGAPLEQELSAIRSGTAFAVDATPALADGVYTAQASQPDGAGDVGTSSASTFTVDTVAPLPTLSQPAPGVTVTTARPTFAGTAGAANGDGSSVAVSVHSGSTVSGALVQTLTATRSGTSWSVQGAGALANGTYTARATQSDAAGNTGTSTESTFTVDAATAQAAYSDAVLASTPRGYWRLGESGGTVAADAIGTSAGAYLGGVTLGQPGGLTGDANTAVRLDGVNDTVSIPSAAALNSSSALSLEALVKPGPLAGTATIMRKDLQYLLRVTPQGNLIFRLWKSGRERELSTAAGVIPTGAWSHVVASYDGATMTIIVNGRSRASMALAAPVDTGTRALYLGASINYDWLPGVLDEAAVYTRPLGVAEAQAHFYAAGITDEAPSVVRLETPEDGAAWDALVTYAGSAGTDADDEASATISVYAGTTAAGTPVRTLTAPVRVAGTFAVTDSVPLASGTYTAQAVQRDAAGNVGSSQASTFNVQAEADPHLVSAGDIAACDTAGDEATAELLDGLFGTVAPLGDLVYEYASTADYDNCYDPSWGRQRTRTRPTPGSHDYAEFQTNGEAYFGYFGALAGDPARGYYSYDLGSWHIVALNSNCTKVGGCGAGSPQEQWLRADLAADQSACTLAYWHDPRFSSGAVHGSNTAYTAFWQALYDDRAEIVLGGHEHVYERFAKQTPNGSADPVRGLRQFTVGTGGRSHYAFRNQVLATSEVRNGDTFGVLDLALRPGSYDWRFVPEAGRIFTDTGSTACH